MAKRISSEEIERAKALYAEGLTLADVGQRIGRSTKAIWRALRGAGVAMQPRNAFQPGHQHSPETREKMAAARRGKPHSAETRAKIAAARRGQQISAETRVKMAAARRGKPLSAETRAKMSAAKRARHKMPAAELAEVVRLYASGMPLLSVAERVGYSPGKIRRELVEAGVTIRAPLGKKAGGGTTPHRPGTHSQVNNTLHVPDDGGHR